MEKEKHPEEYKSQEQKEQDFKELVLSMLPEDEKKIINQIHARDIYYLVFSVYNPYSDTKQLVMALYEKLNIVQVYAIIMNLRDVREDLYREIS